MEEKDIIAQNLVRFRKNAGLSQLDLAKKLNYSNKNISKWEKGETTPSIFVLKKLANLFGVSVDDFLSSELNEAEKDISQNKSESRKKSYFRIFMLLLANAILFSVASVVIYALGFFDLPFNRWLIYLYFSPLSLLSVVIYVRVLYKFVDPVCVSLMGWLLSLAVYLTFLHTKGIAYVFLLSAAYEVLMICICVLVNVKIKRTKNKTLNNSDTETK